MDVAATNGGEQAEPIFAEFFLQALETKEADGEAPVPAAGRASAERAGTRPRQADLADRLERRPGFGLGSIQLGNAPDGDVDHAAEGGRRRLDRRGPPERRVVQEALRRRRRPTRPRGKLSPKSNASKDDAVIPLRMKEAETIDPWWIGRRTVSEHAVLEDCGQEAAVSALRGQGYEPLDGVKEGQPGFLARRTVIGRAALLPLEATR